jgi:hypothetical protein
MIKTFADVIKDPILGFIDKNKAEINSLKSGNVNLAISENQVKGTVKSKGGTEIKLRKVTIKYK